MIDGTSADAIGEGIAVAAASLSLPSEDGLLAIAKGLVRGNDIDMGFGERAILCCT